MSLTNNNSDTMAGSDDKNATPIEIMLVDDDESLNRLVEQYLQNQGFNVNVVTNGEVAIERIRNDRPDLVILDIMLPGTDGLSVCRQVRPEYHGPVLMLTALGDDIDEVAGLETGADDYLAKPVRPRVLLARIRALLRRQQAAVAAPASTAPDTLSHAEITISRSAMSVTKGGKLIAVTDAEFDLLWLLASRAGEILSRDEIYQSLRGLDHDGQDRAIDLRISRLRKKLGDDPRTPNLIKSVRGKGYIFSV